MTVNMPVEVFSERCLHCPEIDVNTITEANHVVESVDEDGTIHQKDIYETHLRCAFVERCRVLYSTVFEEKAAEKKDIPVKVPTVKKTAEKKPASKKVAAGKDPGQKTTRKKL